MKMISFNILIFLFTVSCNETEIKEPLTNLLATFGDQPSVTKDHNNNIFVVFGNEESIYIVNSNDKGESFSEPSLVGELKGLYLGYSSGPRIAITKNITVVTAMNKKGNYFSWSKSNAEDKWSEPVRVNDIDGSASEVLGDLTATPNGNLFAVWIDTRVLEDEEHTKHSQPEKEHNPLPIAPKTEEELDKMTPQGITVRELYKKIGDIPENTRLAFFGDEEENILWVFLDNEGNAVKAESMDEFKKFRERNAGKVKAKGKIYLSSSEDGGKSWSTSRMVYRSPEGSVCECCKPSITSDSKGVLTVMFRNNIGGSRDLHFTTSIDEGETFAEPEKLGSGTWKINGCPMDGGGLMVNSAGDLSTIWQRKGEIFTANSSADEQLIGKGRAPFIAGNDQQTYIVFASGEDIMAFGPEDSQPTKIGTGSSPKVIGLKNGAVQFWVSDAGINYRKI